MLAEFEIEDPEMLYQGANAIAWETHLSPNATFAVRFNGSGQNIRHTQYGALKVKDAVVDRLRDIYKRRPDVDPKQPDMMIDVHLRKGKITLALDISGGGLHQRGYRQAQGIAPMKETLAATMLYRIGWPDFAAQAQTLIDPMCGAGTLLCEALLIASDSAPGLGRERWGFQHWQQHIPALWSRLLEEAESRREQGLAKLDLKCVGFDQNREAVHAAKENLARAGFAGKAQIATRPLRQWQPQYGEFGMIVCNPPYGERLGTLGDLLPTYSELGERFKTLPMGWQMGVIAADEALIKRLRLRSNRQYQAFNGALAVKIYHYLRAAQPENAATIPSPTQASAFSARAEMFANRLRKNLRKLRPWAEKAQTDAYRIYDQDMPEYAVAIDCYGDHAVVQEYSAPKTIDPQKAKQRLYDILQVVPEVLQLPSEAVVLKTRSRQQGKQQYTMLDRRGEEHLIREGQARFLVNLHDYLDTGIFLDHRPMRRRIFAEAAGKRVLNLFCYTGTVSVQAALGGASYTTSVDLSQTYLDWAQRNFDLNGLSDRHRLQRGDVMQWLIQGNSEFDLVFCDPPTFSNTKKENRVFDLQRDHPTLITRAMARLAANGTLYFSTNYRDFKLDDRVAETYRLSEISAQTFDPDFARRGKIHRVWQITHHDTVHN